MSCMMIDAVMYGIDPERDDREVLETTSGEEVEHAEELVVLDEVRQRISIDAGHGNAGDEAENHQHRQREENLPAQDREF